MFNKYQFTFTVPMAKLLGIVPVALLFGMLSGCTIKYTANGASIDPEAKTVNVHFIENRAPNNNPTLGQKLTEGLRQKILAQTKLTQTNEARADYDFKGTITGYSFSNAAVTQIDKPATARLTVTVNITFTKRIGDKKGFQQQSFTRSADFDAQKTPSEVEDGLLRTIIPQLVDDIFNRAYANW